MSLFGSCGIGVDFVGAETRLVEARRSGRGLRYRALAPGAAPRDAAIAAALPAYAGFVRRLTAPIESPAKARRVLPALLDIELPFPIESCSHAFLEVARAAGGGVEALAVAARSEDIVNHLRRLADAGLDPRTLDHEAVILWNQCAREHPLAGRHHRLVVSLGGAHTTLVAGAGARLVAATGLRQPPAEYLGASAPAALRERVGARLAGWWRAQRERAGAEVWHVVWCGPLAGDPDLRRDMAALLSVEETAKSIVPREPELLLARGLAAEHALRRGSEGNLRTGALAHPALARAERRGARGRALALVASAALLFAVNAAWRFALDRRREHWQGRVVAAARALTGTDRLPKGQELLAAERAFDHDAPGWAAFRAFLEPGADARVRFFLGAAHQCELDIQHLAAQPTALLLQGTAGDWAAGERLARALEAAGWRAALERREAGADERVHFTLRGER